MNRYVDDVNVYVHDGGGLRAVDRGVTHYLFPFPDHMVGERLRLELVAAGLPPEVRVTAVGTDADVAIPGDDKGKWEKKIAKALDAHEGSDAADHKRLVEFAGSIHDAARRLLDGDVSQAERDVLMAVNLLPRSLS